MKSCNNWAYRRFHNQTGATAIEYGLIAAGIAVAIIAAVNTLGGLLTTKSNSTSPSAITQPADSR